MNKQFQPKEYKDKVLANDKKLKLYLQYVQQGIILIEVNDKRMNLYIRRLFQEYNISMIDFMDIKDGFTDNIQQYQDERKQNKICYWNFPDEKFSYEIIGSLNLSRELLKNVGIVIFMLPTFLVRQIEEEEPNLYDYITLKLDYRYDIPVFFEPKFALTYRSDQTKTEVKQQKEFSKMQDKKFIDCMEAYYERLAYYTAHRLSASEKNDLLDKDFWKALALVHDADKQEPRSIVINQIDIIKRTAELLCRQGYLKNAYELFGKIKEYCTIYPDMEASLIHSAEGRAFCQYYLGEYASAKAYLEEALRVLVRQKNQTDQLTWILRIQNDIGACVYQLENYDEALRIWQECYERMKESHIDELDRVYRNLYNQLLVHWQRNDNVTRYYSTWQSIGKTIEDNLQQDSKLYLEYMSVKAWVEGAYLGRTSYAKKLMDQVITAAHRIYKENDVRLATYYYVLGYFHMQLNEEEQFEKCMKKGKNIIHQSVLREKVDSRSIEQQIWQEI